MLPCYGPYYSPYCELQPLLWNDAQMLREMRLDAYQSETIFS